MNLKQQHDELLKQMPESATHDAEACPFCNPDTTHNNSDGGGDMKTYTEEEFTAAVKEAVAPLQAAAQAEVSELQAELDALKAAAAQSEVEGQIAEVQAELDKAKVELADAIKRYDDLVAYLDSEAQAAAEKAAQDARKGDRLAAVKEVAPGLDDDYIERRIDAWVAMDDETFESMLEDWKAVPTAAKAEGDPTDLARETAMSTVRDTEKTSGSAAADVFRARNQGVDVRYL